MKESFRYEDVPISDWSVLTEPNTLTGEIRQITTIAGKIQKTIKSVML
jgi:hypothetical protein